MLAYFSGGGMVFNATYNNISFKSWWLVLLRRKLEFTKESHRPAAIYRQTLSHYVVSSTPRLGGVSGDRH